jgi:hypothetical protein
MAIKYIIVLFVETPRKFITAKIKNKIVLLHENYHVQQHKAKQLFHQFHPS